MYTKYINVIHLKQISLSLPGGTAPGYYRGSSAISVATAAADLNSTLATATAELAATTDAGAGLNTTAATTAAIITATTVAELGAHYANLRTRFSKGL